MFQVSDDLFIYERAYLCKRCRPFLSILLLRNHFDRGYFFLKQQQSQNY